MTDPKTACPERSRRFSKSIAEQLRQILELLSFDLRGAFPLHPSPGSSRADSDGFWRNILYVKMSTQLAAGQAAQDGSTVVMLQDLRADQIGWTDAVLSEKRMESVRHRLENIPECP
jgi:hypothetical protein